MSDLRITDYSQIGNRYFDFYHNGHSNSSSIFQFLPDGRIGGYSNKNERHWLIDADGLSILGEDRAKTITFTTCRLEDEKLFLSGPHIPNPRIVLCLRETSTTRHLGNKTRDFLWDKATRNKWSIGDHTYGTPGIIEDAGRGLSIGRYTSIADKVTICLGDHTASNVSTYPFATLRRNWHHVPPNASSHCSKGPVVIGNDVWLCYDALITSGVTIGDGAIIGAKAVVTRDVPPYAVCVGNPGRIVKYRFGPEHIEALLASKWWDLPDDEVDRLTPYLLSPDVSDFINAIGALRPATAEAEAPALVDA